MTTSGPGAATAADTPLTGGCVCGQVRYATDGPPLRITVCHCRWCQRRTGTAFGTECVFSLNAVSFTGEPPGTYRHVSDLSGRWLEQDFCTCCGTNLGLRLEAVPTIRSLAMGSFDDIGWFNATAPIVRHVFVRSRWPLVELPDDVERHERHFRD